MPAYVAQHPGPIVSREDAQAPTTRRPRPALGIVGVVLVVAAAVLGLPLALRHDLRKTEPPGEGIRLVPLIMITGPGEGAKPRFSKPLGVAFGPGGVVVVSDTGNDRVCVFDSRGKYVREWGGLGVAKPLPGYQKTWVPGLLNYPAGIDVTDDGRVFVADFRNDQIAEFDLDGGPLAVFPDSLRVVGRGGSGQDGTGIAVTDVVVEGDRVFATDTYQVFEFTAEGEYVGQFGRPGRGPSDLDHPNGVAVQGDGSVVVADSNHMRIACFTPAGVPRWAAPSWDASDAVQQKGPFGLPRGLTEAPNGMTLVADAVNHELVIVDGSGRVVDRVGERGIRPGEFNFPADVDWADDLIAVADKENDRVQILRIVGTPAEAITPGVEYRKSVNRTHD